MTKLTRHNGRTGKDGTFSAKHNDRRFDLDKADHIDQDQAKFNLYWDYVYGAHAPVLDDQEGQERISFERIEKAFYYENYSDYCEGQHERNAKNGHSERDRTTEDLRLDKRTCPEESILQIGTKGNSVSFETLGAVANDFFEEFKRRFGSNVHILDWALHVDEGTPHIHERHVFDYVNQYGEVQPHQEKALEALGFELPHPDQKIGKMNNRKMVFDKECRRMLFEICANHGLLLEQEPEFGQKKHLEKNDYILEKQKETMSAQELTIEQNESKIEALTLRIEDTEKFIDEITDAAFESSVKVVKKKVIEETHNADFDMVAKVKKELINREDYSPTKKKIIQNALNKVLNKFKGMTEHITERLNKIFGDPVQTKEMKKEVKQSLTKLLAEKKIEAAEYNAHRTSSDKKKHHDIGL